MTKCRQFLLCQNDAIGTIKHPILDEVPTCQRCATKLKYEPSEITLFPVWAKEQGAHVLSTETRKVFVKKDRWSTKFPWRVDVVFYNDNGQPKGPALFGGAFRTLASAKETFSSNDGA